LKTLVDNPLQVAVVGSGPCGPALAASFAKAGVGVRGFPQSVGKLERYGVGFRLTLVDGSSVMARAVVLSPDVTSFPYVPPMFASLPRNMVTHTVTQASFQKFEGQDVAILGRGASALAAAARLHEGGSRVTLISRQPRIHVDGSENLGVRTRLAKMFPGAFHALPAWARELALYKHRLPAGEASLQGRVEGKFPMLLGWTVRKAQFLDAKDEADRRIRLLLRHSGMEPPRELVVRHVVAGTGFRVRVGTLAFLEEKLRGEIAEEANGSPRLSRRFESTAKGLYFVGATTEGSFGPLMREPSGAEFASDRVVGSILRHLERGSKGGRSTLSRRPLL
jgi:cation diffusion facilitator CzcD-associated flavoprotein CzcO